LDTRKQDTSEKQSPIQHLAAFIVDKRKVFYLLFIGLCIFCVFSSGWVSVNDDLTSYLPEETETRRGLTAMDAEFVTFGDSRALVDNVSAAQAEVLAERLESLEGVKSVEFDGSADHYQNGAALFSITYDGAADEDVSLQALAQVKETLAGYDLYVTGSTGADDSANLDAEMQVVMVIAVVIILLVLLFTSHTYMEIPVLLMTFGMAALLNKGTNFIFGEISFVSNSVAVVLQLALAIDYAIILCHRYTEERERMEAREAVEGAVDVIVADGYSGNIFLKTMEGAGLFLGREIKKMFLRNLKSKIAALLVKDGIKEFKKLMDSGEVGGTALMGISKPVIKAHGSSDGYAMKNAIRQAVEFSRSGIIEDITENVEHMRLPVKPASGDKE